MKYHFESKSQTFVKSTLTPTYHYIFSDFLVTLVSRDGEDFFRRRRQAIDASTVDASFRFYVVLKGAVHSSRKTRHILCLKHKLEKKDRKQKDETQQKFKSIHFISNGPKQKMLLRPVAQNALFSSYSK